MRVLHVIAHLHPGAGGPPVVAVSLAVAQQQLGADLRLLAYQTPAERGSVLTQIPGADQLAVETAPWRGRLQHLTGSDVRAFCDKIGDTADFAHLHGVWHPLLREAAAACRRAGVPYAVCTHGALDPWCLQQSALKKKMALWMGCRQMLDHAAFIHAMNDDERKLLVPLKLRSPFETFPNGIFPDQFADPVVAEVLDAVLPRLNGRRYILFLSRLHYVKGLDYLADAFARVAAGDSETQLVVVGPDDGARGDFERRIGALGISERVHLPGALYGAAKHAALARAAVFCLPSHHESSSMAIIEAMACGTPCVISDACHFPQVQSGGAGYVVSLNPGDIAMALDRMLNDASLRSAMGHAAKSLVQADYSWPAIARRLLDAYQRAIT